MRYIPCVIILFVYIFSIGPVIVSCDGKLGWTAATPATDDASHYVTITSFITLRTTDINKFFYDIPILQVSTMISTIYV